MNQKNWNTLEETITRDYGNMAGILIRQDEKTLYESYFNDFTADDAAHIFSVTKSIFSALIGIAIDQGHIKSTDQPVLDFFPDYTVKEGEHTIQSVTLKHLLTMTAPYKCETEPYEEFFTSPNWIETALDLLGGDSPAGEFRYSPS